MVNGNGKPFCHFSIQIKIMANGKDFQPLAKLLPRYIWTFEEVRNKKNGIFELSSSRRID
jgi:hypothetical protein